MEHIGKKVTVFGSFVMDLMGRTSHLSATGETVKGTMFRMGPGGKGFNQDVTAHKAGTDVTMVTKLGQNAFADTILGTMDELRMDTGRVLCSETTETEYALVMVDENSSQNKIVVILGACNTITDQEVNSPKDLVGRSEYLLTQLETNVPSMGRIVDIACREGVKVILNIAPVQPVSDGLLGKIDLVIPSEMEARVLTGTRVDSEEAADGVTDQFFSKGVKNVLIILGQGGVYINTGEEKGIIPAYKVDAMDTTGAGDTLNGGLLAALAKGKGLWETADFANALAALSVQKIGTTPSMPVREEIGAFMAADHQATNGWHRALQHGNYQRAIIRIRTK